MAEFQWGIQALPICICFVYDQRCICFVYVQRFTTNTKNDQSVLIKKKRMINQYFVYKIVVLFIFRNFTYILVIWLLHFNLHILLSNICHTQRQRQQRLLSNYLDKIDHSRPLLLSEQSGVGLGQWCHFVRKERGNHVEKEIKRQKVDQAQVFKK